MTKALLVYDAAQWPDLLSTFDHHQTVWTTCRHLDEAAIADFDGVVCMHFSRPFTHFPKQFLLLNDTAGTEKPTGDLPCAVLRFCGWKTFAERTLWEVAYCGGMAGKDLPDFISRCINRKVVQVKDVPGLVAPRIVASIINEALFTLADQVCSVNDLDLAMKLGTNYPYGPIEWAGKIGMEEVAQLLEVMALHDARYKPHPLFKAKGKV